MVDVFEHIKGTLCKKWEESTLQIVFIWQTTKAHTINPVMYSIRDTLSFCVGSRHNLTRANLNS